MPEADAMKPLWYDSRKRCTMSRYPGSSVVSYSFGPGPMTPAVKGHHREHRRVRHRALHAVLFELLRL